jgi:hypothetical protein
MVDETRRDMSRAASTAGDKGREVAEDAAGRAREVAEAAKEKTGEIGHEVATQGQRVIEEAKDKVREQTDRQSQQLASSLRGWSDQARALAEGRPQDAGQLPDYARQAAGKMAEVAEQVQHRGLEGALDDVKSFARRRPGVFLLGAGIAGFAAGRLLRGAAASASAPGAPQYASPQRRPYASYEPGYGTPPAAPPRAVSPIGRREV